MIDPQIVSKILESPNAKEMVVYFQECLDELKDITDITIEQPIPFTIEAKARQRAYEKLEKIIQPFISFQEYGKIEGKGSEYVT